MKRVLMLTSQLPYPPISGGTIKSWRMAEHLAPRCALSVATLLKGDDPRYEAEFLARVKLNHYASRLINRPRSAWNLLRSYAAGIPLAVFRNRDRAFARTIAGMAADAETLLVDHVEMFPYVPASFAGRVVLHEHNAEYVTWQRMSEIDPSPARRLVTAWEARRIQSFERRSGLRSDVILAAANDQAMLEKLGLPRTKFRPTLHLGDDSLLQEPALRYEDTEPLALYVGTLTWEANIDGLCWFLREVWSPLQRRHPHLRLRIVGRHPDPRLAKAAARSGGVELPGFVADLKPEYSRARVFICPLRFGSGTKVKITNALYRGLPTITSACGAEGLGVGDGLRVAGGADDWQTAVNTLMHQPAAWQALALRGRQQAEQHLAWAPVLREIEEALHGP